MLDIRATAYVDPASEVPFAPVKLTVLLENFADETGLISGSFRIYNGSTGLLICGSDIAPLELSKGESADVSSLTEFSPPAPADHTYFVIFDGNASNALVPDGITLQLGQFYFDVKPAPLGPIPAGHAVTHEDTGIDEIDVTDLSGLLADPQTPILHHLEHEAGGADEVNVTGLSGELADDQPALSHDNTRHDVAYEDSANKGAAGGYCGLPNPLNTALPLRADGTAAIPVGVHIHAEGLPVTTATSTAFFPFYGVAVGGTILPIAGSAENPGVWRVTSAAAVNTGWRFQSDVLSLLLAGHEVTDIYFRPQILANSLIRLGFIDTISSADCTDGVYGEITTVLGVPGTLVGKTAAAAARSTTATSFVLTTNTWYHFRVSVNAAANLVTFSLLDTAGATLWTDTLNTNIPTGAGQNTGCGIISLGATTQPVVDIDAISLDINRALIR